MKAVIVGALIGLWSVLNPTQTRAGPLPPGVSDQVVFTSPAFDQPQTFNFLQGSSELTVKFFTFSAPATATIPVGLFAMGESPPCAPSGYGCQALSDVLSFNTTVEPGTGNIDLNFYFASNPDPDTIGSFGTIANCIEGSAGCGVGAFHVVSATGQVILTADVYSDVEVPQVPEPSTLLLFGSGFVGFAAGRKNASKRLG